MPLDYHEAGLLAISHHLAECSTYFSPLHFFTSLTCVAYSSVGCLGSLRAVVPLRNFTLSLRGLWITSEKKASTKWRVEARIKQQVLERGRYLCVLGATCEDKLVPEFPAQTNCRARPYPTRVGVCIECEDFVIGVPVFIVSGNRFHSYIDLTMIF
jgi:hypothetical protein